MIQTVRTATRLPVGVSGHPSTTFFSPWPERLRATTRLVLVTARRSAASLSGAERTFRAGRAKNHYEADA